MNKSEQMKNIVKHAVKCMLFRPANINYHTHSYILRPSVVHGGQYITLGSHSVILGHGYLSALETYAGIKHQPKISIGNHVYIGRYVYLTAINEITVGDGCVLSEHVYITDLMHGLNPDRGFIMEQPLESKGPVRIGSACFLGYRTSIMPGVTLGDHCVVGANSVVTRSFPAHSMLAGSPARLIRKYNRDTDQWERAK